VLIGTNLGKNIPNMLFSISDIPKGHLFQDQAIDLVI
jgi:hypothetical protein